MQAELWLAAAAFLGKRMDRQITAELPDFGGRRASKGGDAWWTRSREKDSKEEAAGEGGSDEEPSKVVGREPSMLRLGDRAG